MQLVYMRYERLLGAWRVSFAAPPECGKLRDLTFASPEKVEQMAQRGGGLRDLAAKQALETGLRNGLGGIYLHLSPEQMARLRV